MKSLGLSDDEMRRRKRMQRAEYDRQHIRQVQFTLPRDAVDVLAWLDAQPSMQAAVKKLVRKDKSIYARHEKTSRTGEKSITKILGCDKEQDRDILLKLDNVDNRSAYIRDLIRAQIERDRLL